MTQNFPMRDIISRAGSREIPDLLQGLFACELLKPSQEIWLVSPWVSDIPVLDNRANAFATLEPSWARSWVRLSQVLARLQWSGSSVRVVVKPDAHNRDFLRELERHSHDLGAPIEVQQCDNLHFKGLLGDDYYLNGSMNFTLNGISVWEEGLKLIVDEAIVNNAHLQFQDHWRTAKP